VAARVAIELRTEPWSLRLSGVSRAYVRTSVASYFSECHQFRASCKHGFPIVTIDTLTALLKEGPAATMSMLMCIATLMVSVLAVLLTVLMVVMVVGRVTAVTVMVVVLTVLLFVLMVTVMVSLFILGLFFSQF